MCVVHHKLTLVFRSATGFEQVLLERILTIWSFRLTCEKVSAVSSAITAGQDGISIALAIHSLDPRPRGWFCGVSVQSDHRTFVQSRDKMSG